jgi:hypothetical protein
MKIWLFLGFALVAAFAGGVAYAHGAWLLMAIGMFAGIVSALLGWGHATEVEWEKQVNFTRPSGHRFSIRDKRRW